MSAIAVVGISHKMASSIWSLDGESDTLNLKDSFEACAALNGNHMDPKIKEKLQKCLNNMNFYCLNEVQKKCLRFVFNKDSGLICAPRGAGKTVTSLLIAFGGMTSNGKVACHPRTIILCKTLELAKQMNERAIEFTKFFPNITVKLLTRGKEKQKNQMICEDIVIGTPDKVNEVSNKTLDLRKIQTLIVDDADCMVPTKDCVGNIMNRIRCQMAHSYRLILFSCAKSEELIYFIDKHSQRYEEVIIPSIPRNMKRIFLICSNRMQKMKAMVYFITEYKYPGQSVIICNSKENASQLVESCNHVCLSLLHGNMKEKERAEIIELFNEGCINVLVTTPAFIKILSNARISLIFNFDQLLKDRTLNNEIYEERECLIGANCQGTVVNVIEKEWEKSIIKRVDLLKYEIKQCEELFNAN